MNEKKANQASRFAKVAQNVTRIRSEPEASVVGALTTAPQAGPAPQMARPQGKKRDPNYVQVTVYLRKSVHQKAKKMLIDQEGEFSELVDDLVSRWVESPEV